MDVSSQNDEDRAAALEDILDEMRDAGSFDSAVLALADGFPIASAPPEYDGNLTAAMAALLQKVSSDAQNQLDLAEIDEMTIYSDDRVRLVCRKISTARENLILVTTVPPEHCYRRVTNRAIRQIKQLLS
jgi:predicted regulator of Ras-like GTPase activity (Roadblock/LC7/MglB family)